ncbi:hypothetical protein LJB93_02770 [Desulfovibrio sp. OttesenSCG-928-F07]|nr:hypothetical protein [Desulfovibrio sp. OttesenSCG-928-F07]
MIELLPILINMTVAITTLFLAIATWKMARVTKQTLDAQLQPYVIVYAEADLERPEIINIVIANVGTAPAANISFEVPEYFPWGAGGLRPDYSKKPENLVDGPLRDGMGFLVPGIPWRSYWGQSGGLSVGLDGKHAEIIAHFGYADGRPAGSTKNILDVNILCRRTWVDSYAKRQVSALEKQTRAVESLMRSVSKIAERDG